jgi:hypothetical protein
MPIVVGGERRAGATRKQNRRHQRAQLAQYRQPDQISDEQFGAKLPHRHRGLEREDDAEQKRNQRDDGQCIRTNLLARVPDILPAHAARIADREPQRRTGLADEGNLRRDVAPCNQRSAAELLDRTQSLLGLGRRCAHRHRIELIEQRLKFRAQTLDPHLCLRRSLLAQEVDEHRHAAAVAVVDTRCIDDDAPIGGLSNGGAGLSPNAGYRIRIEPSGEEQFAGAVGGVGNGERRRGPPCGKVAGERSHCTSSICVPITRTRSPMTSSGS